IFACRAKFVRINGNARQPPSVASPRSLRHELDSRKILQRLMVKLEVAPSSLDAILKYPQLAATDSSGYIAKPVIVTDFRVLIVGCWIPRLSSQLSCMVYQALIIRYQHTSTRCGYYLISVETEGPNLSKRSR